MTFINCRFWGFFRNLQWQLSKEKKFRVSPTILNFRMIFWKEVLFLIKMTVFVKGKVIQFFFAIFEQMNWVEYFFLHVKFHLLKLVFGTVKINKILINLEITNNTTNKAYYCSYSTVYWCNHLKSKINLLNF